MKSFAILFGFAAVTASAAPPSAAGSRCTPGPYIVFFAPGAAILDSTDRETLDRAVESAAECSFGKTLLRGHSDTKEKSAVAQMRVEVVRDYLAAHGIPRSTVYGESFGATQLRVPAEQDGSEFHNRRVEIMFGPPDG